MNETTDDRSRGSSNRPTSDRDRTVNIHPEGGFVRRDLVFALAAAATGRLELDRALGALVDLVRGGGHRLSDQLVAAGLIAAEELERVYGACAAWRDLAAAELLKAGAAGIDGIDSDVALGLRVAARCVERGLVDEAEAYRRLRVHLGPDGTDRPLLTALAGDLAISPDEIILEVGADAARAAAERRAVDPVGEVIDGVRIIESIGEGAMGRVYLGEQVTMRRKVAVKFLGGRSSNERLERFRREYRTVASLEHPNLPLIHQVGEYEGVPYYVSEYLGGGTLEDRIVSAGTLLEMVDCLAQAARGLGLAHSRGLVHRDVKPENVLIDEAGTAKIVDFGLAHADRREDDTRITTLTRTGQILGTPAYMAPEQAAGTKDSIGPPTDVYACGVILYRILYGCLPHDADNPFDLRLAILEQDPVFEPGPPEPLLAICRRCLARDPASRFLDAGALADELDSWLEAARRAEQRAAVKGGLGRVLQRIASRARRPSTTAQDRRGLSGVALMQRRAARRRWRLFLLSSTAGALLISWSWLVLLGKRHDERARDLSRSHPTAMARRIDQIDRKEAALLRVRRALIARAARQRGAGDLQGSLSTFYRARLVGGHGKDVGDPIRELLLARREWASFEREAAGLDVDRLLLDIARRNPRQAEPWYALYLRALRARKPSLARGYLDEAAGRDFGFARRHGLRQIVWRADGARMVLVDAGWFWMGSEAKEWRRWRDEAGAGDDEEEEGPSTFSNEEPRQKVHVDAFYIDRHPVTWRRYRRFLEALRRQGAHPSPWCAPDEPRRLDHDPARRIVHMAHVPVDWTHPDLPVVGLTWWDAFTYARWAGKSLPTEAMWEKAARWDASRRASRVFPWGDAWDATRLNSTERWARKPILTLEANQVFWRDNPLLERRSLLEPVGSKPRGASPWGVHEMAGSVWEWMADWYGPRRPEAMLRNPGGPGTGAMRVLKGGSWASPRSTCRPAYRWFEAPGDHRLDVGMRCASGIR